MNTAYFDKLVNQINNATSCEELAFILSTDIPKINQLETQIANQLTAIAPLLISPTSLPGVITWINAMINNYLGPQATLLAHQAEITAQLARVMAALSAAQSALGCP